MECKALFARLCNWTQSECVPTDAVPFYTFLEAGCRLLLLWLLVVSAPISLTIQLDSTRCMCSKNSVCNIFILSLFIIHVFKWCRATSRRVLVCENDQTDYIVQEGGQNFLEHSKVSFTMKIRREEKGFIELLRHHLWRFMEIGKWESSLAQPSHPINSAKNIAASPKLFHRSETFANSSCFMS